MGELEARPTSAAFARSEGTAIFCEHYLAASCAERGMFSAVASAAVMRENLDRFLFAFPVRLCHLRKLARA
jgi:hypothetical protein